MLLYSLVVKCYHFLIFLASPFNGKARKARLGRKNLLSNLKDHFDSIDTPILWMHCASVGEFEQGKPLLERIAISHPHIYRFVTFYSPSGMEAKQNDPSIHFATYLPFDSRRNAEKFLQIVKPQVAIFVKYEFWFHILSAIKANKIPAFLVSASFTAKHFLFSPLAKKLLEKLHVFDTIFMQNVDSENILRSHGDFSTLLTGDTRVDRVIEISNSVFEDKCLFDFTSEGKILIAGSTWSEDEELLENSLGKHTYKVVLVPHEVNLQRITEIKSRFGNRAALYSDGIITEETRILIIDKMGLLSKLYRFGSQAYIGGGFGSGIHNTLEAAVYGIPVAFGPKYEKFPEARSFVKLGVGECVTSGDELANWLSMEGKPLEAKQRLEVYFNQQRGATDKILEVLNPILNR